MANAKLGPRTTDPHLLERVRDWRDGRAWTRFVAQYDPRLRAICRARGLAGQAADDCCQYAWLKLADAMQRFHCDPGRRFGAWVLRFFDSRVVDALRASRPPETPLPLDDVVAGEAGTAWDERSDPEFAEILRRAEGVPQAVRARITPESWETFRLVAIEG